MGEGLGVFGLEVMFEEVVWLLGGVVGCVVKGSGGEISCCCSGGRVAHFCARAVVALVASGVDGRRQWGGVSRRIANWRCCACFGNTASLRDFDSQLV